MRTLTIYFKFKNDLSHNLKFTCKPKNIFFFRPLVIFLLSIYLSLNQRSASSLDLLIILFCHGWICQLKKWAEIRVFWLWNALKNGFKLFFLFICLQKEVMWINLFFYSNVSALFFILIAIRTPGLLII